MLAVEAVPYADLKRRKPKDHLKPPA